MRLMDGVYFSTYATYVTSGSRKLHNEIREESLFSTRATYLILESNELHN